MKRCNRVLMGLLFCGLVLIIGMFLFMDNVSAAISYTPSFGALASTTSLNNSFVEQLYAADKAGALALRTATKTANESAPVAHTYKFEPADYLMLGGSNNDFYVTLSGWDATLLNLTVRIYGTNWFGVNQSEDLYFTGNSVVYTTLLYRTSNSSMVFKCWKTGAFSVSVVVSQGQWGRVWKNSVNSYRFVNCTPALSGFYNQTNTSLSFYPASSTLINFGTAGKAIFGNLSADGVARWGCTFINEKNVNGTLGATAAVTYIKFYACSFMSYRFNRSSSSLRISETLGMLDVRNCVFSQNSYIISGGTNSIFSRNTIVSAVAGVGAVLGTTGSCSDMFFANVSIPLSFTNSAFTGSNFTLGGYDYLFKWNPTGSTPYVHYFRNFKVLGDLKAFYYGTATGPQKVLLEYGISLRVRNGTANLSGATVQYFEINASTLVRKRVQSLTSGADGLVTYKFLNRSIWLKSNVYPRSNYTVSVWINKSGYQSVRMNFTMSRELVFDVVMLKNRSTPSISLYENVVNISGTHQYSWNGTGFNVWYNGSSPLVWFLHAINSTLTHQQSWTGSQMNLYVNSSGNLTAIHVSDVKNNVTGSVSYTQNSTGYWVTSSHESTLTQFLNLVNAHGTHQKVWTGSTWYDWANVTGNATSSVPWLTVINPNPGNGTHMTNFIKKASNLTTSLDVSFKNFTIPPESPISSTVVISSDADDGETGLSGANYNAVWSSSTGVVGDTGISILLGQFKVGSTYYMDRGFFFFDTSSIPSDAIIDSAKLTFILFNDVSTTDFDITIQNGQPTYPHKPLVVGDFNKAFYSGDGGNFNTAGLPVAGNPFDINLNALGLTWINKGGTTKFSIRSSREIAGIQPTGIERINIYTFEQGTTYIPKLNITYQVPGVYSNWSNVLNVSWFSNSSGPWLEYSHSTVTSNGTVTVPALNFSGVGTYYWRAECESNHTTYFNTSVFSFTTVGNPTANSTNLTVNEFNTNVTGGYTSLYNPLTGWIVNNTYTGITTPLHQLENIINATGTHTYLLNGTGYWDWANYTGNGSGAPTPITLYQNLVNATGTHQYSLDGSGYHVWSNATGNTTAVTLHESLVDAIGTHIKILRGLGGWDVYANYTGTGGGGPTPIHLREHIINASGTHTYSLNGSGYWVDANYTGNTTPVTLFQNFINATGTHVKQLGPVGWSVWANVTGNVSSSVNVTRWLPLNMGVFGGSTMMLVLFSLMAMCTAILGARRRKRRLHT